MKITETEEIVVTQLHNGMAITTRCRTIICDPAEITWIELRELVKKAAKEDRENECWLISDNHDLFGYQEAESFDELVNFCAHYLNEQGVSIVFEGDSKRQPFKLDYANR